MDGRHMLELKLKLLEVNLYDFRLGNSFLNIIP